MFQPLGHICIYMAEPPPRQKSVRLVVRVVELSPGFEWFLNRAAIGTSAIKTQSLDKMLQMYPVVALGEKGQKVATLLNLQGNIRKN